MASEGNGLERFGTRALELGLGIASLGLGAVALARALGQSEPLALWAVGLGAVPPGTTWGLGLGALLLAAGALLVARRAVPVASGALALLTLASLLTGGLSGLGAIQDVGLLGGALSLLALPASLCARLPRRLALLVDPDRPAARRLALRLGLGLTFLLAGWHTLTNTGWYGELLAAAGGWLLGGSPTGTLLWLGAGELLLSVLLVYGPPARLASALAAVLLALDVLALHTPSLLVAKAIGLLGAAVAGYCWASGIRQLTDTSIGWLRSTSQPPDTPPAAR